MSCPFCKCDPYEYVDVGVGRVPVAINCCELRTGHYHGEKKAKQALRFMRSHSPRKKARAQRICQQYGQD